MKLQYIGDVRDAFKWDLLHCLITTSKPAFDKLHMVPMLTPAIDNNEGNIPHHQFDCRPFIRSFLTDIRQARTLNSIKELGSVCPDSKTFEVNIYGDNTAFIGNGSDRAGYWSVLKPELLKNSIIFFDPDNGFETKTQKATKWLRHNELRDIVNRMPENSVIVVYQHRPRRTWDAVFNDIAKGIDYALSVDVVYESNLAFVVMSKGLETAKRVKASMVKYSQNQGSKVRYCELI
jgi:hypothetical protein